MNRHVHTVARYIHHSHHLSINQNSSQILLLLNQASVITEEYIILCFLH